MRTLAFLLSKEFRQIFRNTTILRIIIVMPIMQLLLLPQAATFDVRNVTLCVVDHDRTEGSRQLIDAIAASGYMRLAAVTTSYDQALSAVEADHADLAMVIPRGFASGLVRDQRQTLSVAVNAINGVKGNLGASYLATIIRQHNTRIRASWLQPSRTPPIPQIDVITLNRFNPHLDYKRYMVPGIMALLITMIAAYLSALNIVKEKEVGTIEQINVTPIRKVHFILGKLIPFWLIGLAVLSIGLLLMWLVYGIVPVGSVGLLYAFAAIYIVAVLGLGLLISTLAETQQQAMFVAFFFMMIFIMLGGLFTAVDSMPGWAQWLTRMNPVRYFIEVMRMVVLKGSTFHDIRGHLSAVAVMAIVVNGVAVLQYRKTR